MKKVMEFEVLKRVQTLGNQCNRPDLLENMMVKLRSVYVRWLVDFDPWPLSVSLHLRSVYSSCYFDYKQWKTQWIVNGREANTVNHNSQE